MPTLGGLGRVQFRLSNSVSAPWTAAWVPAPHKGLEPPRLACFRYYRVLSLGFRVLGTILYLHNQYVCMYVYIYRLLGGVFYDSSIRTTREYPLLIFRPIYSRDFDVLYPRDSGLRGGAHVGPSLLQPLSPNKRHTWDSNIKTLLALSSRTFVNKTLLGPRGEITKCPASQPRKLCMWLASM